MKALQPSWRNPLKSAVDSLKLCDELVQAEGRSLPDALRQAFAGSLSAVYREVDTFIAADLDADDDIAKIEQMLVFLKGRKAYILERQEVLRELAKEAIEANPDGPLRGSLGTIYTTRSRAVDSDLPEILKPDEAAKLPPEFVRSKTTYALNKTALAAALKAGVELAWARLKESTSLAIRTKTTSEGPSDDRALPSANPGA